MTASKVITRLVAALALSGLGFGLAGCNTVQGFGQDVNAAGNALKRAAE
ncbi:entericidin A/B family lipoprotein [Burkholderia cepacia]|uniref:Entericidin A/B family lipoprotein n=1 Tax=Burkholderia cepacia TaxID=292 RepID=A0AAX2RXR1_BURCE|nr:entericidin A/B family lipoprotein [Burkholderia cepacia]TES82694.1 entericidin A/B family lipoprotein [Burkholderia cepacia]TET02915.1 entericidin A/B family lipoprotein [Burkholderia cepacia]TEU51630.1 entericidin A/B family lipoprotein [Burkholderia cepacia]TEU53373.1 entericidin A/B family lipoprotein [Burkholderia cepacia]TEV04889.1 entericidin A/B family lipoprotein [Burkholderia cepacia]